MKRQASVVWQGTLQDGTGSVSTESGVLVQAQHSFGTRFESGIGTMLPCNVIVQELADGTIDVAAVDPLASMQSIRNPELQRVAKEIQVKLKKVIAQL